MQLCGFEAGLDRPFFLLAGPCVLEGEQMAIDIAGHLKEVTGELGIPYVFKASYDKANRTSGKSFRGPGMEEGLRILDEVRRQVGVPVITDVHTEAEVPAVAAVADILQTPAFLRGSRLRPSAGGPHPGSVHTTRSQGRSRRRRWRRSNR